jgi:hypothetical protein
VFGQGEESTYADAVRDVSAFMEAFADVPIDADPRILNPTASEYAEKLSRFDDRTVMRIRVAKFNTLVAVYVDKERICFGGKHTTYPQALEKAMAFAHSLLEKHPGAQIVNSASKSATGGCSPSWGENLEGKTG